MQIEPTDVVSTEHPDGGYTDDYVKDHDDELHDTNGLTPIKDPTATTFYDDHTKEWIMKGKDGHWHAIGTEASPPKSHEAADMQAAWDSHTDYTPKLQNSLIVATYGNADQTDKNKHPDKIDGNGNKFYFDESALGGRGAYVPLGKATIPPDPEIAAMNPVDAGDTSDHADRHDKNTGLNYTWDPDLNDGKGKWAVYGKTDAQGHNQDFTNDQYDIMNDQPIEDAGKGSLTDPSSLAPAA